MSKTYFGLHFRAWDHFNKEYFYSVNCPTLSQFFDLVEKCINGGNKVTLQSAVFGMTNNDGMVYVGDLYSYKEDKITSVFEVVYDKHEHGFRKRYTNFPKSDSVPLRPNLDFKYFKYVGTNLKNPELLEVAKNEN